MRTLLIAVFASALFSVNFAFANTVSQEVTGAGGTTAASAEYSMNIAVGEPAAGQSLSPSYIYDHGTSWAGSTATPPDDTPIGGGGGSGSSGGSSGSGWESVPIPELGVTAPIAAPAPSAVVSRVASAVPKARSIAVSQVEFPRVVQAAIVMPTFVPQVVGSVDENNTLRELAIVLTKRIIPWPLWLALVLVALGVMLLGIFFTGGLEKREVLWGAGVAIVLGLIVGLITQFAYRSYEFTPDFSQITDSTVVSPAEAGNAVRNIFETMPLGAHRITVSGTKDSPQLVITVYVKGALPI